MRTTMPDRLRTRDLPGGPDFAPRIDCTLIGHLVSFAMPSLKHASSRRLIAVICIPLLCLASIAHAAEVRLGVAPRIKLPEGSPTYSEELVNFWGNNIELLTGSYLRARTVKNHAPEFSKGVAESIRIEVTQVPRASILLVSATGADEAICGRYLEALVHEFLAFKGEDKKKHYDDAIQRVKAALDDAKDDAALAKSLTNYRDQLNLTARLDTLPVFELLPKP